MTPPLELPEEPDEAVDPEEDPEEEPEEPDEPTEASPVSGEPELDPEAEPAPEPEEPEADTWDPASEVALVCALKHAEAKNGSKTTPTHENGAGGWGPDKLKRTSSRRPARGARLIFLAGREPSG